MKIVHIIPALVLGAIAVPAAAQDAAPPKPITVSGSVGIVSDYRFRGVSQTDKRAAIQGGFTIAHESGFYIGTWGSNLAGWGTFGGANMELDLFGGYKKEIASGITVDVGLLWYNYPGGFDKSDVAEPYLKVSGALGPAAITLGAAYAPKQESLGRWYLTVADYATGVPNNPGAKEDNLYLSADAAYGIPTTPLTLKAHVGHSSGNKGLGPNGTSLSPTGEYLDYSVGVDFAIPTTPLTLNVSFIDTDIAEVEATYLRPNFESSRDGSRIDTGRFVVGLTAAF